MLNISILGINNYLNPNINESLSGEFMEEKSKFNAFVKAIEHEFSNTTK